MPFRITTLIENNCADTKKLECEHGLSFLIETPQTKLLFDCGATDKLLSNAQKMNIDIKDIDYVLCSHAHDDHTGGFRYVANATEVGSLITGKGFFQPKFVKKGDAISYIGPDFDTQFLEEHHIQHIVCDKQQQLDDFCWVVSDFARSFAFEGIPQKFLVQNGSDCVQDTFLEEICLVMEHQEQLYVVVGCSHPGILNMLQTISQRFQKPIHSVYGGTHLVEADQHRITQTLRYMEEMGVQEAGLLHCSGQQVHANGADFPKIRLLEMETGTSLVIE